MMEIRETSPLITISKTSIKSKSCDSTKKIMSKQHEADIIVYVT